MARKVGNFKPNPDARPITAEDLGYPWPPRWPSLRSRTTRQALTAPVETPAAPVRVSGAASPTAAAHTPRRRSSDQVDVAVTSHTASRIQVLAGEPERTVPDYGRPHHSRSRRRRR